MTRRFEFSDAKSNKFWEITVKGKTVTVQYGRLGTNGQTQVKNHATPAEAKAAAEKQIAEKVKKGYQEVGGAVAASAPRAEAKSAPKAAAKKAPAKKEAPKDVSAAGGVDKKQLAAIWTLLGQHELVSQHQGIALLLALDDPALWASLAEGLSLDEDGRLVIPDGCEVHKRVSGSSSHGKLLALWALRQEGRLAGVQKLDLRGCKYLTNLTPLAGLTGLRTLNLSGCEALTDLTELAGLTGLHTLDLSGCKALTDLTPLAGPTGLRTLNLSGCEALTDLTPLAGLTGCFPSVPSLAVLEFEVLSSFHSNLLKDVTAGPWRVRIRGFESSDDPSRFTLPLSYPILDALSECLGAEAARGEGLRNLNVFLTSIGPYQEDFDRLHSKRGETRWSFDELEIYLEDQRIQSWWNGTKTDYRTYDIDDTMPEGQFRTYGSDAEVAVPSESLAVLAELIDEVRDLRDADEDGDYDRENGFDALSACSLTVLPSQWGVLITEHDSWARVGRGEVPDWKEVPRGTTLLEEIGILLERVESAVPQASARKKLWPVVLSSTINENEDAKERKWTAAERKRRLNLARTAVEQFAAAASTSLDAVSVYLFVGTANGEPDAPDRITFDPYVCRSETGRWWKVEDALDTWLDPSNKACLDAIDEQFFRYEETITIGIRTALPFVASHRGCAISDILAGADLGRDHTFNGVNVWDGEPHWIRYQGYAQGEFDSGLFLGFSDEGWNDREMVKSYYLEENRNSSSPGSPFDSQRLLRLLSEVAMPPDA